MPLCCLLFHSLPNWMTSISRKQWCVFRCLFLPFFPFILISLCLLNSAFLIEPLNKKLFMHIAVWPYIFCRIAWEMGRNNTRKSLDSLDSDWNAVKNCLLAKNTLRRLPNNVTCVGIAFSFFLCLFSNFCAVGQIVYYANKDVLRFVLSN